MKWLYIILILLLVGGGVWFATATPTEAPEVTEETSEKPVSMETNNSFKGSMKDLLGRAGAWKCDVTITTEGITSTGTTYVADGKMRSDFSSSIPQVGEMQMYMIVKDNMTYSWSSLMNRGFKFPIQNGDIAAEDPQAAAMWSQNYDYNCSPWTADASKFELPSNVTF